MCLLKSQLLNFVNQILNSAQLFVSVHLKQKEFRGLYGNAETLAGKGAYLECYRLGLDGAGWVSGHGISIGQCHSGTDQYLPRLHYVCHVRAGVGPGPLGTPPCLSRCPKALNGEPFYLT